MLKRVVIIGIALCLVIVAGIFTIPKIFLSSQLISQQLAEQISHWTGRKAQFSRSQIISFFPNFIVELEDVTIMGAHGVSEQPFMKMERLQGSLEFWGAVSGKAVVSDFKFIRPEIRLITNQIGRSNWHFRRGEIAAKLSTARDLVEQADVESDAPDLSDVTLVLGNFKIQNGVVIYQDIRNNIESTWSGVNLNVDYPNLKGIAGIEGDAIWNGEVVKINAKAVAPLQLLAGGKSDITLLLDSKPLVVEFDGNLNSVAKGLIKGKTEISSHSARHFLNWAGYEVPPGSTLGPFEVSGDVLGTISELKFTDASIKLDGNESTGILTINKKPEQLLKISGTLALDQMDISPYLAQLIIPKEGGAGVRDLIDLSFLDSLNLDLRLSASGVRANEQFLENVAGTVRINEGRATLDIGQANIFDGNLQMVFHAQDKAQKLDLHMKLSGNDLAFQDISKLMPLGNLIIEAKGNLNMDVKASGGTDKDLLKTMTGSFELDAKQGRIEGVNIEKLAELKQNGGLSAIKSIHQGSTEFDQMQIHLQLHNGVTYLTDVSLQSQQLYGILEGTADFSKNALALYGNSQVYAKNAIEGEQYGKLLTEQAFIIGGTLNTPFFVPDFWRSQQK